MLHHNSRYRRFLTRPYFYSVFFISLFFLLIWWNSLPQDFVEHLDVEDQQRTGIGVIKPPIAKPLPMDEKKANIVQLTVFMEAQCPDTTGFIRRQLLPAWSRLGSSNRINVSIVPFGKASCTAEEDDYKCECQHGVNECELNQLMNCAIDLLPDSDSHIPLIGCIQGKDSLISAFRSCLTGHSSADWLWKCTIGKRGRRLHAIAGNRTASIGEEFNFVPWVVLDGLRDNDAFYALEENLCKRLNEPKPHPCSKFS